MSSYEVLQPVVVDGVHYTKREVGRVVEADAKQAKALVESGHLAAKAESRLDRQERVALELADAEAQEKPRRSRRQPEETPES